MRSVGIENVMDHGLPESVAVEARARLMWGEQMPKVRAFLMSKSVGEKQADALIEEILSERAEVVRRDGFKKLWLGSLFIAAPVAYYCLAHFLLGYWSLKLFAALLVLGVVGLAKLTSGISMMLRPRGVVGDLSNAAD